MGEKLPLYTDTKWVRALVSFYPEFERRVYYALATSALLHSQGRELYGRQSHSLPFSCVLGALRRIMIQSRNQQLDEQITLPRLQIECPYASTSATAVNTGPLQDEVLSRLRRAPAVERIGR